MMSTWNGGGLLRRVEESLPVHELARLGAADGVVAVDVGVSDAPPLRGGERARVRRSGVHGLGVVGDAGLFGGLAGVDGGDHMFVTTCTRIERMEKRIERGCRNAVCFCARSSKRSEHRRQIGKVDTVTIVTRLQREERHLRAVLLCPEPVLLLEMGRYRRPNTMSPSTLRSSQICVMSTGTYTFERRSRFFSNPANAS